MERIYQQLGCEGEIQNWMLTLHGFDSRIVKGTLRVD